MNSVILILFLHQGKWTDPGQTDALVLLHHLSSVHHSVPILFPLIRTPTLFPPPGDRVRTSVPEVDDPEMFPPCGSPTGVLNVHLMSHGPSDQRSHWPSGHQMAGPLRSLSALSHFLGWPMARSSAGMERVPNHPSPCTHRGWTICPPPFGPTVDKGSQSGRFAGRFGEGSDPPWGRPEKHGVGTFGLTPGTIPLYVLLHTAGGE